MRAHRKAQSIWALLLCYCCSLECGVQLKGKGYFKYFDVQYATEGEKAYLLAQNFRL